MSQFDNAKIESLPNDVSLQADIYLFKVKNREPRTMCEICSKLTIKLP